MSDINQIVDSRMYNEYAAIEDDLESILLISRSVRDGNYDLDHFPPSTKYEARKQRVIRLFALLSDTMINKMMADEFEDRLVYNTIGITRERLFNPTDDDLAIVKHTLNIKKDQLHYR